MTGELVSDVQAEARLACPGARALWVPVCWDRHGDPWIRSVDRRCPVCGGTRFPDHASIRLPGTTLEESPPS